MLNTLPGRKTLPAFTLSLTLGVGFGAPAAHAGFFEQLFGVQPQQAEPAPTYGYGYQQPETSAPIMRRRPKKHVAVVDKKPVKQKVTDLMHDDTLHPGDAVMMKDGIHIYQGPEASRHDAEQFVALDEADDLSKKKREALVAMDTTRNDPLRGGNVTPDTIASGRSASVSAPVNAGFRITDARGKSMRYVGP